VLLLASGEIPLPLATVQSSKLVHKRNQIVGLAILMDFIRSGLRVKQSARKQRLAPFPPAIRSCLLGKRHNRDTSRPGSICVIDQRGPLDLRLGLQHCLGLTVVVSPERRSETGPAFVRRKRRHSAHSTGRSATGGNYALRRNCRVEFGSQHRVRV